MRIKNPAAVAKLLELALRSADERRRVIFYCACEFPCLSGKLTCYRREIADLLLEHAKKIGLVVCVANY